MTESILAVFLDVRIAFAAYVGPLTLFASRLRLFRLAISLDSSSPPLSGSLRGWKHLQMESTMRLSWGQD